MNTIRRNQRSVTTWLALIIISAVLCLISPSTAEAAIAVDAVSTGSGTDSTITVSHTTGSGENRLMLVFIAGRGSTVTMSGVTYNAVPLTFVGQLGPASNDVWIYRLVAPDTGTHNVVVTFSDAPEWGGQVGVMTFTGVDQTTPLGTFVSASADPISVDVSSAPGELVADIAVSNWNTGLTVGPGQTEQYNMEAWYDSGGSTEPGAATVTMSWSASVGGQIAAVPIKPVSAPWLTDWCKRVKITIDHNDFDEDATHFPVLIHLSSACGKGSAYDMTPVFDEVGANSKRIAVTKDDGETQLYVEIEKWDAVAEEAWLWVSKSDWTISSTVDTNIYLYYCNTQSDNTDYVGDVGSTPGKAVWDSNYKSVWHMNTSSWLDSTLTGNTLTAYGGATTGTGKVGTGVVLDGTGDYLRGNYSNFDNASAGTYEFWLYYDTAVSADGFFTSGNVQPFIFYDGSSFRVFIDSSSTRVYDFGANGAVSTGVWMHFVVTANNTIAKSYKNGTQIKEDSTPAGTLDQVTSNVYIGSDRGLSNRDVDGTMDEIRISNIDRSAAWVKASYETQRDDMLAFGTESGTPTAVTLTNFKATQYEEGVLLRWKTGYEVNNLGFHLYREENRQLVRLTPEPVAGSAFLAGSRTPLTVGRHYHWWDTSMKGWGDGEIRRWGDKSAIRYWLKDIDLNGTETMHGPVSPIVSRDPIPERFKPELLSEVGWRLNERYEHYWKARELKEKLRDRGAPRGRGLRSGLSGLEDRPSALRQKNFGLLTSSEAFLKRGAPQGNFVPDPQAQWFLASRSAVKLFVREEGWYRISLSELVAAGLNSKVNPHHLQLYADGREQPIRVIGKGNRFDAIEFYGTGLDTPSTDTRVYWLIEGSKPGKRITPSHTLPPRGGGIGWGGQISPGSFPYTVEVKDRVIYLPAIKNGEEENFFGAVIYGAGVDQLIEVKHLEQGSSGDAFLEVSLQGATTWPHRVKVYLNEQEVGEVVFGSQSKGFVKVEVAQSLLLEGDNLVTLIPQGGEMDVSLVDTIRLTYWHTYTAEDNGLRLKAQGGEQLSIGGFGNSGIRVFDITEPSEVIEVSGRVQFREGSYAISFRVPGAGRRTLLALTEERIKSPEGIDSNQPSLWHQVKDGYDLVIVTDRDFLDALQPLKKLRESQGLRVALIDVEDLYDEFSFGNKSPHALKDFLSLAKKQWRRAPRFVLLVGDASFDPRNYLGMGELDFVPTKLIDTAYLETASDDWFVDFNGDGLPEVAIGRLPVQTVEEAGIVVSKIVGYERASKKNEALLVADRVDNSDDFNFEGVSEEVGGLLPSSLMVRKIYRGQFGSDSQAKGELLRGINQGPLLVNFIGHGSIEIWRGIFTSEDAEKLINKGLPFFVSMTCLNGYFQDPYSETLGEALLKASQGGAIAIWTSSGLTEPDKQAVMNKELIGLLFGKELLPLGEATAKAKASVSDQDIRRTWILFGDPSTKLK